MAPVCLRAGDRGVIWRKGRGFLELSRCFGMLAQLV
jgi:hypothetical protein